MEKLQAFFNFTNKDGEVITFFNGKVTLSQLVVGIIAIIAVVLVLKFIKGIVRTISSIAIICVALVQFGIASPDQIKDVASVMADKGASYYQTIAKSSDYIKYEDDKLLICTDGDKWINVTEIKSIVTGKEGVVTITTANGTYTVSNKDVIKLLDTFK